MKVYTDHGVFEGKKVIVSLPLGVLQQKKVAFMPELPEPHQELLSKIGYGFENKVFASFEKPFWGKRRGWLNFVTKTKNNPFPVAFIMSTKSKHILCFFIAGSYSLNLASKTTA